jgi:hypothetical protein
VDQHYLAHYDRGFLFLGHSVLGEDRFQFLLVINI